MAGNKRKAPDDEAGVESQTGADCGGGPRPKDPRSMPRSGPDRPRPPAPGLSADCYFRRLYQSEPDFRLLGKQDPAFAAVLQDNGQLDFSDPAATMQLTKTLLDIDFGLKIELPDDRLCPPVPNRHNYILWLKELMDSTSYEQPGHPLCGLDIGTGASCIYPLLGTAQRPWTFIATDIDPKSLSYAQRNITLNDLQTRIHLLQRNPDDNLIPLDDTNKSNLPTPINFVMMNPPFYTSPTDLLTSAAAKSRPPLSACTGAPIEMVCTGGEVAHIGRLIRESLALGDKVQWYTSMVGKLSSLEVLVSELRERGVDNYAVGEFVQGNKTRRWVLGWSLGGMRPSEGVARGGKGTVGGKKVWPAAVEVEVVRVRGGEEAGKVVERMREVVGD